ncbi:MAG: hypothetical protein GF398_08470 [Chitinivibrionales bacterium]|nr:hypothetical protein [Chitinivibrionales bacterium]
MIKRLILIAPILMLYARASGFDLLVDQLGARQISGAGQPSLIWENSSGSAVTIDSVTVEELTIPEREYHFRFKLTSFAATGDSINQEYQYEREGTYRHGTTQRIIEVPAGKKLYMHEISLDLCIWCSGLITLRKSAALNDEMKIKVIFYSGGGSDDIEISSKQTVAKPDKPAGLQAQAQSMTSVKLTWDNTNDGVTTSYIVHRNGDILDTTDQTSFTDNGLHESQTVTYRLEGINNSGMKSDKSDPATTTTPADKVAPELDTAGCFSGATSIVVVYNEEIDPGSAMNPDNYSISNNITVNSVDWYNTRVVNLVVSPLTKNTQYSLTIKNVRDNTAAKNTIRQTTVKVLFSGSVDDFGAGQLGPAWNLVDYHLDPGDGKGSANVVNNQLVITAGGMGLHLSDMQFTGVYRNDISGDFDVSVEVVKIDVSSPAGEAGIMAINNAEDNASRTGLVAATFEWKNNQAKMRIAPDGRPGPQKGSLTMQPPLYLRLKREGDTFSGFIKDAQADPWTQIGSKDIADAAANPHIALFASRNGHSSSQQGATIPITFDNFSGGGAAGIDAPDIIYTREPLPTSAALVPRIRTSIRTSFSRGVLDINFPTQTSYQVMLLTPDGRQILHRQGVAQSYRENLAAPSGYYILHIVTPSTQRNRVLNVLK